MNKQKLVIGALLAAIFRPGAVVRVTIGLALTSSHASTTHD